MKIFVTGAAGYIGGSVSDKLLTSGHEVVGLARSEDTVPLLKARGIDSVVGTLDDVDILTKAAQAADAVVHAANADHPASVVTLVTALERSGKLLIHTTGSAIVADHADGEYAAEAPLTEDSYFAPVPYRRPRVDMNRYIRQADRTGHPLSRHLSHYDLRGRPGSAARQRPDSETHRIVEASRSGCLFRQGVQSLFECPYR